MIGRLSGVHGRLPIQVVCCLVFILGTVIFKCFKSASVRWGFGGLFIRDSSTVPPIRIPISIGTMVAM